MSLALLAELLEVPAEIERKARESKLLFVRSQDHLALFREGATGRRLLAVEALEIFGVDLLREIVDRGSAILPSGKEEPSATFRKRRESLGLSPDSVARRAGIKVQDVINAENSRIRTSIHILERLASVLSLDERLISWKPGADGDNRLAVRLKAFPGRPEKSASLVVGLSEAAWVIRTEERLKLPTGTGRKALSLFSSKAISERYTYWRQGYDLAAEARRRLGIDPLAPIDSMRSVCQKLEIPLVLARLPRRIAGATVSASGSRGIVVNIEGDNENVWVRRATLAHELGHFLWDADDNLESVVVDEYHSLMALNRVAPDPIESRANAFAIAFLAPPEATEKLVRNSDSVLSAVRAVMETFGISYTAAKHHVSNVAHIDTRNVGALHADIDSRWDAMESFTLDYFPLSKTPETRRGSFAASALRAYQMGFISEDTLCSYLWTNPEELRGHMSSLVDIFGIAQGREP